LGVDGVLINLSPGPSPKGRGEHKRNDNLEDVLKKIEPYLT
jgi:hypothetical protein